MGITSLKSANLQAIFAGSNKGLESNCVPSEPAAGEVAGWACFCLGGKP
jgi:hypothetical protein